jgi:SAM-dependent methyltransferase
VFAGRDQRRLRLLDVGCGTGRFLDFCKQAWPRLPALGIDLSEAYAAEAKRHLKRRCWIEFMVANGEAIPLQNESQDAVTSVFMLRAAAQVRRRLPRVRPRAQARRPPRRRGLTPDRRRADYDSMLELFRKFPEPYYRYIKEDFRRLAGAGSAYPRRTRLRLQVMVFDKPRGAAAARRASSVRHPIRYSPPDVRCRALRRVGLRVPPQVCL